LEYVDADGNAFNSLDLTKFIGTDYAIFDLDQICPFIGAKLERNEYCIFGEITIFLTIK